MRNNLQDTRLVWMPWSTVLLAGAVLLLHWLPGARILAQTVMLPENVPQLITWWTGHLVHWTDSHLLWDLIMFLLLGFLLKTRPGSDPLWALLTGAPLLIAMIAWLCPDITSYRGLSGLDCILAGMLCSRWFKDPQLRLPAALFGAALVGKAMVECGTSSAMFAGELSAGVRPLASAHLIGFSWGMAWEWLTSKGAMINKRALPA